MQGKQNLVVAIIDDGVNLETFTNVTELDFDLEIANGHIIKRTGSVRLMSHGTYVAAIIRKYAPQVHVGSIKVMKEGEKGDKVNLVLALEWCRKHGIRLVNMSNGTTDFMDFDFLWEPINQFAKSMLIIAAQDNRKRYTIPAELPNVIGVSARKELPENELRIVAEIHPDINCYLNLPIEIPLKDGPMIQVEFCNSYHTAAFSGLVAQVLNKNVGLLENRNRLFHSIAEKNQNWLKTQFYSNESKICSEIKKEVPVVWFNDTIPSKFVQRTAEVFRREGSMAITVLEDQQFVNSCMTEIHPHEFPWIKMIQWLTEKYQCDIILLSGKLMDLKVDFIVSMDEKIHISNIDDGIVTEYEISNNVELSEYLYSILISNFEMIEIVD